jgi:hypothetical protein
MQGKIISPGAYLGTVGFYFILDLKNWLDITGQQK